MNEKLIKILPQTLMKKLCRKKRAKQTKSKTNEDTNENEKKYIYKQWKNVSIVINECGESLNQIENEKYVPIRTNCKNFECTRDVVNVRALT